MKMKSLDDINLAIQKATFIASLATGEDVTETIDAFFKVDAAMTEKEKTEFVYDMFNLVIGTFVNDNNERDRNFADFLANKDHIELNFKAILNKCNEVLGLELDVDLHCKAWYNYIYTLLNNELQKNIELLKEVITEDFILKVDRRQKLQILSGYLECLIQDPDNLQEIKRIKDLLVDSMNEN